MDAYLCLQDLYDAISKRTFNECMLKRYPLPETFGRLPSPRKFESLRISDADWRDEHVTLLRPLGFPILQLTIVIQNPNPPSEIVSQIAQCSIAFPRVRTLNITENYHPSGGGSLIVSAMRSFSEVSSVSYRSTGTNGANPGLTRLFEFPAPLKSISVLLASDLDSDTPLRHALRAIPNPHQLASLQQIQGPARFVAMLLRHSGGSRVTSLQFHGAFPLESPAKYLADLPPVLPHLRKVGFFRPPGIPPKSFLNPGQARHIIEPLLNRANSIEEILEQPFDDVTDTGFFNAIAPIRSLRRILIVVPRMHYSKASDIALNFCRSFRGSPAAPTVMLGIRALIVDVSNNETMGHPVFWECKIMPNGQPKVDQVNSE
ncbi:hypothetical protein SISSUDRAFT_1132134 [Sistotremastrum suecicum HHB10207 ss-3]|uniref:Uncharacterized protein n=1 Tax=Sistotremastrum suecicum HHB10207 ss-3 TaxID=1314776 RepID=A0A165Z8U6_9AGAM|nr:hypothetical protein SISSUDRAFT_1132134 [Sistotremastrum suecicum HHB10207 ss-3]